MSTTHRPAIPTLPPIYGTLWAVGSGLRGGYSSNGFYSPQRTLAIIREPTPSADPMALALQALVFVLGDEPRADRFLALTGLTPDALRAGVGDPVIMGAVLEFLANHEADLVAAADALAIPPESLARAWEALR